MKSKLLNLAVFLCSLCLSFFAAELFVRWWFPVDMPFSNGQVYWDHWAKGTASQTQKTANYFNSVAVYDAQLGLISKRILEQEKKLNSRPGFKVLLLGDSIMYSAEFSSPLKKAIQTEHPEVVFDFFNASTPGWDTEQEMSYLKRIVKMYRPNLVLLQFCLNDFSASPVFWRKENGDFVAFNAGPFGDFINFELVSGSRLLQQILYTSLKTFPFGSFVSKRKVYDSLQNIHETAKQNDSAFHIVILPFLRKPELKYDTDRINLINQYSSEIFLKREISNFLYLANDEKIENARISNSDYTHPNEAFSAMLGKKVAQDIGYLIR